MRERAESGQVDTGLLVVGFILGLVIGGGIALFNAPRSGQDTRQQLSDSLSGTSNSLRSKLDTVVPTDPVAESIAEGKAAARRRRSELGMNDDPE